MVLAWSRILRSSVNNFIAPSAEFICHFLVHVCPDIVDYHGQTPTSGGTCNETFSLPHCEIMSCQKISAIKISESRAAAPAWMDLKQLSTVEVVCSVMLSPLHKCTTRGLVALSWLSQEYIIWYILHLEWPFPVIKTFKFLEIWDWHPIALNKSIFCS